MSFNNGTSQFGFGGASGSGGGGGGLTQVITNNTCTLSFYGQGTAGNPLCACPILSVCPNQGLVACSDGLFVDCSGGGGGGIIVLGAGTLSSVRCGVNNSASGDYSGAFGGQCNVANNTYSIVIGGL
jgi:hypothetical protein